MKTPSPVVANAKEIKVSEQFAYSFLSYPAFYNRLMDVIGASAARKQFIDTYVRPSAQDNILDIGCGTGEMLDYLPQCNYFGIDLEHKYIEHAKNRYGSRGTFLCTGVDEFTHKELSNLDIVIASGLLHHLNDQEATAVIKLARRVLKPKGRLVTIDGCYVNQQSPIARFLLSRDRGRHVRSLEGYNAIFQDSFDQINFHILHNMLRIPFTHVIFECQYL